MEFKEYLETSFDKEVAEIGGLKWLPWIGEKFNQSKILILGESQYEDGDLWQDNNIEATRTMISARLFSGQKGKLYTIVEKVLLSIESVTKEQGLNFWKSVAYYNLVQRLMSSIKERPCQEDFDKGWDTFFKLIDIIKPSYCIVLGKSSCGRLGYYLNSNNPGWVRNKLDFYASEKIINLSRNGEKLILIFINHPTGSRGFNYGNWANLINSRVPELKQLLIEAK